MRALTAEPSRGYAPTRPVGATPRSRPAPSPGCSTADAIGPRSGERMRGTEPDPRIARYGELEIAAAAAKPSAPWTRGRRRRRRRARARPPKPSAEPKCRHAASRRRRAPRCRASSRYGGVGDLGVVIVVLGGGGVGRTRGGRRIARARAAAPREVVAPRPPAALEIEPAGSASLGGAKTENAPGGFAEAEARVERGRRRRAPRRRLLRPRRRRSSSSRRREPPPLLLRPRRPSSATARGPLQLQPRSATLGTWRGRKTR